MAVVEENGDSDNPVPLGGSVGVKVETKDLMKVYRTGSIEVVALRGLNMSVNAGEIVSIMGPSGCGKTTLLNLIGGLDKPSAGSVSVDGLNLTRSGESDLEKYRLKGVGNIFQFFNLMPSMTAGENVELPMVMAGASGTERSQRSMELLSKVGLRERADQKPEELSGGEQQRVAIACALANDPPLILADEPTGELDRESAKRVIALLVSLTKDLGKTAIMVTHDPIIARSADRILRLEDGLVTGEYAPAQLAEFAPKAEISYVEEVQARIDALERESATLESDFKAGKLTPDVFIEKYNSVKETLRLLNDEVKRHGL